MGCPGGTAGTRIAAGSVVSGVVANSCDSCVVWFENIAKNGVSGVGRPRQCAVALDASQVAAMSTVAL